MSAVDPKPEPIQVRFEHPIATGFALAWGFLLQSIAVAAVIALIAVLVMG